MDTNKIDFSIEVNNLEEIEFLARKVLEVLEDKNLTPHEQLDTIKSFPEVKTFEKSLDKIKDDKEFNKAITDLTIRRVRQRLQ